MRAQQMPGASGHGGAGGGAGGGGGAPGAPPIPIGMPHPIAPGVGVGALGAGQLGGLAGAPPGPGGQHPSLSIISKQELHRPEESKSNSGMSGVPDDRHRQSISPPEREKYRPRSPSDQHEMKKIKKEEKDMGHVSCNEFFFFFYFE